MLSAAATSVSSAKVHASSYPAGFSERTLSKLWLARSVPDGIQAFKKNILLYPDSGDLAEFDPWLIAAEDWIRKPGGFEEHPHRGFETITIMLVSVIAGETLVDACTGSLMSHQQEGELIHTDRSAALKDAGTNTATIRAGDIEWITTGRGVVHSEMPGGDAATVTHLLQIWLNLAPEHKMVEPRYQIIRAADIPHHHLSATHASLHASTTGHADGLPSTASGIAGVDSGDDSRKPAAPGGYVRVIAGPAFGLEGPASTYSPVTVLDVVLDKSGASVCVPVPLAHRGFVYVLEGSGNVGGKRVTPNTVGLLSDPIVAPHSGRSSSTTSTGSSGGVETTGETSDVVMTAESTPFRIVMCFGAPHKHPVAARGPFVMTTDAQVRQAFADYRAGLF